MNIKDAQRKGYELELKPVPETNIHVTVPGIAEAIQDLATKLEPKIIQVANDPEDAKAMIAALEQSNKAVIHAANKIPPKKLVTSCDMEHEYDERNRPIRTHVEFNYRDA